MPVVPVVPVVLVVFEALVDLLFELGGLEIFLWHDANITRPAEPGGRLEGDPAMSGDVIS